MIIDFAMADTYGSRSLYGILVGILIISGFLAIPSGRMLHTAEAIDSPVTQMDDTTASYGLSIFSTTPLRGEYVTASSALVGDNIDTIKISLKKVGSPTGSAIIGVFRDDYQKVVHMSDSTNSFGLSVYSGRQIQAEYVGTGSALIGDKVTAMKIQLRKGCMVAAPTGTATIGVFASDLSVKKQFGTQDVSTLTTLYVDHWYNLTGNDSYMIQEGDYIGIKFTGGDANNCIAIMTDQNVSAPFDGTASHLKYYTTSWVTNQTADLYMVLDGFSGSHYSVVRQFGTQSVSSLTTAYVQKTFTLPTYTDKYTIQSGDFIGVVYPLGNASNQIAIMTDQNTSDPFDGQNTHMRAYSGNISDIQLNLDYTMTLVWQYPDTTPPSITAPDDLYLVDGSGGKSNVNLGTPSVSDSDSPNVQWHYTLNGIDGTNNSTIASFIGNDVYNITWTATDVAGNTAHAYQEVGLVKRGAPDQHDRQAFIMFDDGYASVYTLAKPILDQYNINNTQFIECGRAEDGLADYMNFTRINALNATGRYEIQGHTLRHPDLSKVSASKLAEEVSRSCMIGHGYNINSMAIPFNAGYNNITVINAIKAAGYTLARGGNAHYQDLHCDLNNGGFTDCYPYTSMSNTTVKDNGRFSLRGLSHDGAYFPAGPDSRLNVNNTQMLEKFIDYLSEPNQNTANLKVQIPLIYYHRIVVQNSDPSITENTKGVEKALLKAEMQYLTDNGVKALKFSQLAYNGTSNWFSLTGYGS